MAACLRTASVAPSIHISAFHPAMPVSLHALTSPIDTTGLGGNQHDTDTFK